MSMNVDLDKIKGLMEPYFFSNPQKVLFWMYYCSINKPVILRRDIEELSGLRGSSIHKTLGKLTSKKYRYVKTSMVLVPEKYRGAKWMMKLEFTKDEYRDRAKDFYQLICR